MSSSHDDAQPKGGEVSEEPNCEEQCSNNAHECGQQHGACSLLHRHVTGRKGGREGGREDAN